LIWHFTLVLIKINYGQIEDQTGLFYTTNPVFYTSENRFVRRTGTFGNLIFSLVPSDNRNTRSTCPKSVFTGIEQTLMLRPDTIKKLGHNIVLKEIQHLTGMTHCASFSGMEQFGSGSRGTVNCFTLPAIFKIFL
jgi:hypothetical protein